MSRRAQGRYHVPVGRLLLAFILIPVVELFLLIEIGRRIGTLPTLLLIVATGVMGAWLVRLQGLSVLRRVQAEMAVGRMPAGAMVDGIIILIAGVVLMTPGVLTDAFGFACLVPAVRSAFKGWLRRRLENTVKRGDVNVTMDFGSGRAGPFRSTEVRDITPHSEAMKTPRLDRSDESD